MPTSPRTADGRSRSLTSVTALTLALVLAACGTAPQDTAFVAPDGFSGFRPGERALAADEVDPTDGKPWSSMSSSEIRERLPNRLASVLIERQNTDGTISLAAAPVTGGPGAYGVVMDYLKYATVPLQSGPDGQPCLARIGVGIRIRVQVVTLREHLNLGSLLAIGTAARAGDLTGSLAFELIGVDATDGSLSLPLSAEIQEESLRAALAAINAIEARLGDPQVTLRPHLVGWQGLDQAVSRGFSAPTPTAPGTPQTTSSMTTQPGWSASTTTAAIAPGGSLTTAP